ncbi:hypothetical protein [Hydrogenophaga crassostreae]|nr:hypothetical protein [Hydrogenophaga crassostreae]
MNANPRHPGRTATIASSGWMAHVPGSSFASLLDTYAASKPHATRLS